MSQPITDLGKELRELVENAGCCDDLFNNIVEDLRYLAGTCVEEVSYSHDRLVDINGGEVTKQMADKIAERLTRSGVLSEYICPDRPGSGNYLLVQWDEESVELAEEVRDGTRDFTCHT